MSFVFSRRLPRAIAVPAVAAFVFVLLAVASISAQDAPAQQAAAPRDAEAARLRVAALIKQVRDAADPANPYDALIPPRTEALEVVFAAASAAAPAPSVLVAFNNRLGERVWTPAKRDELLDAVRASLGDAIGADETLAIEVRYGPDGSGKRLPLQELVTAPDQIHARQRVAAASAELDAPVVRRLDNPAPQAAAGFLQGFGGRNLVVGPSHGWLWHKERHWQFQRSRLLTTIEDLYPASYVNPFLIPMLEHAGAIVWSVRERDYQTAEVIVDNDLPGPDPDFADFQSRFETTGAWETGAAPGWRGGVPTALTPDDEPFQAGTTLRARVDAAEPAAAVFTPYVPRMGRYAVYAAWPQGADQSPAVPVEVRHLGGATRFTVNQQVAGGTWVFLGFFEFDQGADAAKRSVAFSTTGAAAATVGGAGGEAPTYIAVDAVRLGGGVGNVAPDGLPSGHPRVAEGSRYWLQYAGAPKDPFWGPAYGGTRFSFDYNRDIVARAEWSNWLNGAPLGPNNDRSAVGLGVPVEVAFSWHTDAGVDPKGTIGTLVVYNDYGEDADAEFPDGRTRLLNRDLMQLMQDEIVRSVRSEFTSTWARRDVRQYAFGECRRPNVPSGILELLSHQNFNDMKYGLDPRFKFTVSRAIYKALLRFVAYSHGFEPIVTPLAPTHIAVRQTADGGATLSWRAQSDPLEPSAEPTGYIVYASSDGRAFDNGTYFSDRTPGDLLVDGDEIAHRFEAGTFKPDTSTFFRVAAANDGGESFPSPVVGLRIAADGAAPVLVVDGFQRICGPAIVEGERARGFDRDADPGVGFRYDYGTVGDQYDYDPASEWKNDLETPGWGASRADLQDTLELGNTFDYVVPHGAALAAAGRGFDSMTLDAFADGFDAVGSAYGVIDWIAGRQRTTPPPAGFDGESAPDRMKPEFEVLPGAAREKLRAFAGRGGKLLLSGACVVEDLTTGPLADDASREFASAWLGVGSYRARATTINTAHPAAPAAETAEATEAKSGFDALPIFRFGNDLDATINLLPTVYRVESAEAYNVTESARGAMMPVLVYGDTGLTAGLAGPHAVLLGFPLETVQPAAAREALMKAVLDHLAAK